MPTYEYACTNCGERTEAKQSFSDPPLEECPHCGGKLRKLFSPVGIVFKGTGFYATDARKSSKSSDTKKDPKKDPKTESATSTKDTKPAGGEKAASSGSSTSPKSD